MEPRKGTPWVIGGVLLAAETAAILLDWGPWRYDAQRAVSFWMAVAGGPACLLAGLLASLRWLRPAGALLWLGASVLALGIALGSGVHVGAYFLGLGLFVLPQAFVASLLLIRARVAGGSPRRR